MAPYKRGTTFVRLQVYERVSISFVEVYKRVETSVISVGSRSFLKKVVPVQVYSIDL